MAEKNETLKTTGKPIIKNPNGSISTEESITVQVAELNKGRPTNIPSIVNGKRVSERDAIGHAITNQPKMQYKSYNTVGEAVKAAEERSNQLGKDYQKQRSESKPKQNESKSTEKRRK